MAFTVGMHLVTDTLLSILYAKQGIIRSALVPTLPTITQDMLRMKRISLWNPAIPLDALTKADILIRRLEANGIDLVNVLARDGRD